MLYLDIISGKKIFTIPFDRYSNNKRDMSLNEFTFIHLDKIINIIISNNTKDQTYTLILRENNRVKNKKTFSIFEKERNVVSFFFQDRLSSNLYIELNIQSLFDELPHYKIIVEEDEIEEVYDGEQKVDLDWFLENIYYKNENRSYRKLATYLHFIIMKDDIKC